VTTQILMICEIVASATLDQPGKSRGIVSKSDARRPQIGTYLQFEPVVATVPAQLTSGPTSGCGARSERSILTVFWGLCGENVSGRFRSLESWTQH